MRNSPTAENENAYQSKTVTGFGSPKFAVASVLICLICRLGVFGNETFSISASDSITIDSILSCTGSSNHGRTCSSKPRIYLSYSYIDIPRDAAAVTRFLTCLPKYDGTFRWVKRVMPAAPGLDSTYYFEMGTGPFGYWAVIDFAGLVVPSPWYSTILFKQNKSDTLNACWRKRSHGLVVIENNDLLIQWRVRGIDSANTRVAFVILCNPKITVPAWLVNLAFNMVAPNCLTDMKKAVMRAEPARTSGDHAGKDALK